MIVLLLVWTLDLGRFWRDTNAHAATAAPR